MNSTVSKYRKVIDGKFDGFMFILHLHFIDFAMRHLWMQEHIVQQANEENQQLEPWTCPRCGEENEGQFGSCWQCSYMVEEQTEP
jgi:hypothetical protein